MSIEKKAARILAKMYMIRRVDFTMISVRDIIMKATPEQINYYYYWFFEVYERSVNNV